MNENGTPYTSAYSASKPALVVHGVAHAAQPAADHLFAQELRAEGADAEDVRHGVRVPAFGEHRHRHDAPHALAELAGLADRVHHLAQQVFVGQVVGLRARESARGTRP